MDACHVLLGRPWMFYRQMFHDRKENTHEFLRMGSFISWYQYWKMVWMVVKTRVWIEITIEAYMTISPRVWNVVAVESCCVLLRIL